MNNLCNVKKWDDQTTIEQFIRRVKIFFLQERIHEVEKQVARYQIEGADEYLDCLREGITHQVEQIQSLSFPLIEDIILSPASDPFVDMSDGSRFNTDTLFWDKLFQQPVQVVTNAIMSQSNSTCGNPSAPCIIDERLFISIDVNTNSKRLLNEFSKLINKEFIPHNATNEVQVTATPKIIRENAFIQILDYRIIKKNLLKHAHKQPPKPAEDEVNFVIGQIRYRFHYSDPNTSTVTRATKDALKKLDKWLVEPAYIAKLLNH